ncbi:MAG TPA: hypothetical protein VLJ88_02780 [Propionibacteriaceae bacterium]|nr:hypothetical protein [Propionibacteriaceae bacterium]
MRSEPAGNRDGLVLARLSADLTMSDGWIFDRTLRPMSRREC